MHMRSFVRPGATAGAFLIAMLTAFAPAVGAQGRAAGLPDFTELYEKNGPAVV
jgi:hypothetical protein